MYKNKHGIFILVFVGEGEYIGCIHVSKDNEGLKQLRVPKVFQRGRLRDGALFKDNVFTNVMFLYSGEGRRAS